MNAAARIGILGGTLDPIHLGHIDAALAARAALSLDRVIVIPSRVPPHRQQQPLASPYHRFAMTALAVNGVEGLVASDMELCTPGPSYTAHTLTRYRLVSGLAPSQIFFITGADAFAEIETWFQYPAVLGLTQFAVVSRPGFQVSSLPARLPDLAPRMLPAGSMKKAATELAIYLVDAATSGVSSTEIRRRLKAGEPIAGLVPPSVETHIRQHDLYADVHAASRADHLHGQD
jgi:nicotinate-nucleotide adenylyltransferase